jgi:hypothetical protein
MIRGLHLGGARTYSVGGGFRDIWSREVVLKNATSGVPTASGIVGSARADDLSVFRGL